jgi:hypothetical protein
MTSPAVVAYRTIRLTKFSLQRLVMLVERPPFRSSFTPAPKMLLLLINLDSD